MPTPLWLQSLAHATALLPSAALAPATLCLLAAPTLGQTVLDLVPGAESSFPGQLVVLDSETMLFVAAATPSPGAELWRWTPAGGPELVKQLGVQSFPPSGDPELVEYAHLTPAWIGGKQLVFFSGNDGKTGREPWVTDGTPAGTLQLANLVNSSYGSFPTGFTAWNGSMFFAAQVSQTNRGVFVTDGTPAGTELLTSLVPYSTVWNDFVFDPVSLGDEFVFGFDEATHGNELWKSDGTPAGTDLWLDLVPGPTGSNPGEMVGFDDKLVLQAYESDIGSELYVVGLDGAAQRWDLTPGTASSKPSGFVEYQGALYFSAVDAANSRQLWKLPAGDAPPVPMGALFPGAETAVMHVPTPADDGLYLTAWTSGVGTTLWHTQGVPGDLQQVPDLTSTQSVDLQGIVAAAGGGVLVAGKVAGEGRLFHATATGLVDEPAWAPGVSLNAGSSLTTNPPLLLAGQLFAMGRTNAEGYELVKLDHDRAVTTDLGATAATARLATSDPRLGQSLHVELVDIPSGALGGALAWSLPTATAELAPFAPGNGVVLDLAATMFAGLLPGTDHSLSFMLPNDPALSGLALHLQAGYLQPDFTTFWTSNGVRLDLGD